MTIKTFQNPKGNPIIRKCANCKNWKALDEKQGYCQAMPLFFAYSLTQSMFAVTRKYNYCETHELVNEAALTDVTKPAEYDVAYLKQKQLPPQ